MRRVPPIDPAIEAEIMAFQVGLDYDSERQEVKVSDEEVKAEVKRDIWTALQQGII
jgi:hypothetical protein